MTFLDNHQESETAERRTWPDRYNAMLDALDDATGGMVRRTHSTVLSSNDSGPISVPLADGFQAWRVIARLKSSVSNSDEPFDLQIGMAGAGAVRFLGARIEQGIGDGAWSITNEVANDRILVRDILHDSTTASRFTHLDVTIRRLGTGRTVVSGELIQTNNNSENKWVRFSAMTETAAGPTELVLATQASADFAVGNELHSYAIPTA